MLETITGSIITGTPTITAMLVCTACSLVFGLAVAGAYMFRNRYSKSLVVTLVLLPATVQIIIMLVNGNLGAGVAVAGAFSLVRFRSLPGNARDICCLFFAMAVGFATGMGYVFYAFIFLLMIGGVSMLLTRLRFGQGDGSTRVLRITIPEDLDYDELFVDVFEKYAKNTELDRIKTVNMGSLYELTYYVRLKPGAASKAFIDDLRCRNGNLSIMLGRERQTGEEL